MTTLDEHRQGRLHALHVIPGRLRDLARATHKPDRGCSFTPARLT
jgi:hypothetical protein